MPKLYFFDTGLACHLLHIEEPAQLHTHFLRGGIVENMVVSEFLKYFVNAGTVAPVFFWRD